jgi:hypothetical protein
VHTARRRSDATQVAIPLLHLESKTLTETDVTFDDF